MKTLNNSGHKQWPAISFYPQISSYLYCSLNWFISFLCTESHSQRLQSLRQKETRTTTAKRFHIVLKWGGYVWNIKNYHSYEEFSIAKNVECTYWIILFPYIRKCSTLLLNCGLRAKSIVAWILLETQIIRFQHTLPYSELGVVTRSSGDSHAY